LGIVLGVLPLAACGMSIGDGDDSPGIPATGSGGSRTYAASGFDKISMAGADDVDVTFGNGFAVRAEGSADDLDSLRIRVSGDTLTIDHRRSGTGWNKSKARVHVTLPRLTKAELAGSGTLTAEGVQGDRFSGGIAGSGNLVLRQIAVSDASFELAGSGKVTAAGTARKLDVEIAGSGSLDAAGLRASEADISMAGSGNVRASVAGPAKISMMGSGDVDLGREAKCTTEKMGSGTVRCG
jgi:hypothetical protein